MTTCTCPKRTENGFLQRVGRDIACPAHGDTQTVRQESGARPSGAIPVSASADQTAPLSAPPQLQDVPSAACETAATPSAGLEAIEKAQAEIIQTPERAREALRERADLPGERYD